MSSYKSPTTCTIITYNIWTTSGNNTGEWYQSNIIVFRNDVDAYNYAYEHFGKHRSAVWGTSYWTAETAELIE